jgi:hypothetical protein
MATSVPAPGASLTRMPGGAAAKAMIRQEGCRLFGFPVLANVVADP